MNSSVSRKLLCFFPVFVCLLLCSCTTAMTWGSLGKETFTWNPDDMHVSIRTEQDKRFLEHKTVSIVKKGVLKKYFVPYDFNGTFPLEKRISRRMEFPVRGNLPIFTVKIDPDAKPVMVRLKRNQVIADSKQIDYSYVGFAESAYPYSVTPDDFKLLQKPFWFRRNPLDCSYCIPMKAVKIDTAYQIPVMVIYPGGEQYLSPDELRTEEIHPGGFGLFCARLTCSILPFAFDLATFPFQWIIFSLI